MKRATTGVVCLVAAWTGAYAAPRHHGEHPTKEAANLGDVMRNSIQDAIRGAVSKVVARKARHEQDSMSASHSSQPHMLTQRASLRGRTSTAVHDENPWEPVKPLRIMDNDLTPTSPASRLGDGIEDQRGAIFPPGYYPRVVYYDKDADRPNPFPQTYNPAVPNPPENFLICTESPPEWTDKKGIGCEYYATALWCTEEGKPGLKWKKSWGPFSTFARNGVGAAEACCQCGGGARTTKIGRPLEKRLSKRHLLAPPDRLPDPKARWFEANNGHFSVPARPLRPLQAPEDYVPMPIKGVGPLDKIPVKFARYFKELHKQKQKDQPRGFSVQYFKSPPKDCGGAKPSATALDVSLDYDDTAYDGASLLGLNTSAGYSPVGLDAKSLEWPGRKNAPKSGLFWAKWSGTVEILDAGKYSFNLDIGFNTKSEFKIDGQKIQSRGQCKASADDKICSEKGCAWDKAEGKCKPKKAKKDKNADSDSSVCQKGTYRDHAVLFGCQAETGHVDVQVGPSGETSVFTVPKGVKNFRIAVESLKNVDLHIKDNKTNTYVVKFDNGIVNNQELQGTYHGMALSWSGDGDSYEHAMLSGVTSEPLQVSIMNWQAAAAPVKLVYSHLGLGKCPGKSKKDSCKKFEMGAAKKKAVQWASRLVSRYGSCPMAWKAVTNVWPGGQIAWTQWETVWSLASGGTDLKGDDWKIGFAMADSGQDGYVDAAEFSAICGNGMGSPSPAPAPQVEKPGKGGQQHATLDTCLTVRVMDKGSWPKDAFKGSGYKDDPALQDLIGSPQPVKKMDKKGVLVASPYGTDWFYPKGTFYCYEATHGELPSRDPPPMVSTRGPAPSIANIVPEIVGSDAARMLGGSPAPASLLQEDLSVDEEEDDDGGIFLAAGGHCIEAMVMVTPAARNLKLLYTGPDTNGEEVVVPSQVVNCDPVIPACTEPLREVCAAYRPQCSAGPAPAAAA